MLGSHGNPSRCGFRQPLPCLLLAIFFCLCPALLPGLFLPPSLLPVPAARACIPLPWCFPLLVSWYPLAPGAPVVSFIAACLMSVCPWKNPGVFAVPIYSYSSTHRLAPTCCPASPRVSVAPCSSSPLTTSLSCCLLLASATRLLTTWRACCLPACYPSAVSSGLQFRLRSLAVPRRGAPFMLACAGRALHGCPSASLLAACFLPVSVPWRSHSSPSSDRCPPLSSGALPYLPCLPCSSLPPILPASSSGSCIFVFVLQSWSSLPPCMMPAYPASSRAPVASSLLPAGCLLPAPGACLACAIPCL